MTVIFTLLQTLHRFHYRVYAPGENAQTKTTTALKYYFLAPERATFHSSVYPSLHRRDQKNKSATC